MSATSVPTTLLAQRPCRDAGGPFASDAMELARAGWEVQPLRAKVPATAHGVLDATGDFDQIREWVTRYGSCNIGARVPAGLIVIDTDPRHGGEANMSSLAASHGGMVPTLTVCSGREDGGRHRYYRHPGGSLSATRLPDGVDLKLHSGYMVMPPSIHPATGQPYRWESPVLAPAPCPRWLVSLLRPPVPRRCPKRRLRQAADMNEEHLVAFVEGLLEGNRNNGLYWAACRAREAGTLGHLEDALIAAAVGIGLTEEEARTAARSASRIGG